MWATYFELVGTGLAFYALMRLAIGWELRERPPKFPRHQSPGPAGQGIDTSALTGRVEKLREDAHAGAAKPTEPFKKPWLVEERRREIGKNRYFQKPPVPEQEPPEHEGGVTLLFI
jgi:hypothetical protein